MGGNSCHYIGNIGYSGLPIVTLRFLFGLRFNKESGVWAHSTRLTHFPERKWLSSLQIGVNSSADDNQFSKDSDCLTEALGSWRVKSLAELFAKVVDDVNRELLKADKLLEKRSKKTFVGTGLSATSSSSLNAEGLSKLQLEHLRWFVVDEDLRIEENGDVSSNKVDTPIEPARFGAVTASASTRTDLRHAIDGVSAPHVAKRNAKFRARTGEAVNIPFYVTLANGRSAREPANVLAASTVSKGEAVGSEPGINNASIVAESDTFSQAQLQISSLQSSWSESSAVEESRPSTKCEEPMAVDTEQLPSCSNGMCTMRDGPVLVPEGGVPIVAEGADNPLAEYGIKVVGVTYLPSLPVEARIKHKREADQVCPEIGAPPVAQPSGDNELNPRKLCLHPFFGKRHVAPPKKITKLVGQAILEWGMIEEGDKLLLGLSGGKDSLALLHILLAIQKRAPINFDIACATVDPQTASFDPSPLIPYVQSLGVVYHYLSHPIVEMAKSKLQGDSLCAFCSRFKRGLLYSCCRSVQFLTVELLFISGFCI
jgi:hypothetical protein